ncbi:unnamed protein product [Parnassius apollo]|uniref:(apollo) hypothetical protein n=1 Tax=Parnassius apollo TaxID=110799 RepID=A0A8S3XDM0_PARAO|nr:unnamed protein product [Parnassius apollo]
MDSDSFDNVTYRKRQTTGSLDSIVGLSISTDEHEKSILETTMMSLPDSLHNDSNNDIINSLNEEIKILKMQLMSAHQEIENLNCENFRLKSDLQKSLKTVETYKNICVTPDRKNNTSSSFRKKKYRQQKLPVTQDIELETIEDNNEKSNSNMLNKETQTTLLSMDAHTQTEQNLKTSSKQCNIANKNLAGTKSTSKQKKINCV